VPFLPFLFRLFSNHSLPSSFRLASSSRLSEIFLTKMRTMKHEMAVRGSRR
jgi:hypothetical protein